MIPLPKLPQPLRLTDNNTHYNPGNGYSGIGGKIPSNNHTINFGPLITPAQSAFDAFSDIVQRNDPNSRRKPYRPSPGRLRPPSARKTWDYYEAPLAEKYGFGKATAYQEALANTAYRREMDDMRKAGLNPSVIYGSHNTSGADSSVIPRDGSGHSGGSGGYSRRSRGGNSGKYLFSGGSYYGIMAAVGAMTALATHNVGAGMAAAGLTGTALKAFNGFSKRK